MTTTDAFGLAGKVCVVTGAASGVGQSVAVALAGEGAKVAILDRNEAGLKTTLDMIVAAGGVGLPVACDVSSKESIEFACATVTQAFGAADLLVNNAAIGRAGGLADLSLDDWNDLLTVNLTGYFLCSQAFGRGMRARGSGVIIHISSVMADYANPFGGAYSVAKGGVKQLSKQITVEWGPDGVRSVCIQPCLIVTPLSQKMYDQPGVTERRSAAIPAGRIGVPDDIAQAVLFIASPRASYISGTDIMVDGGFVANLMSLIPRPGNERSEHVKPAR